MCVVGKVAQDVGMVQKYCSYRSCLSPANIEFELEAILSVEVVFQLNSDYCTNIVITGDLHCIILNYEAWLCYYEDTINLNSQACE